MELTTPVTTALFDYDTTTEAIEDETSNGRKITTYGLHTISRDYSYTILCLGRSSLSVCPTNEKNIKRIGFKNEILTLTLPTNLGEQDFNLRFSKRGESVGIQDNYTGVRLNVKLKRKSQWARAGTADVGDKVATLSLAIDCQVEENGKMEVCGRQAGGSNYNKWFVNKSATADNKERIISFFVTDFVRTIAADKFPAGVYGVSYDVDFYVN